MGGWARVGGWVGAGVRRREVADDTLLEIADLKGSRDEPKPQLIIIYL